MGVDSKEREWFVLKVTFIYLVGVLCAGVPVRGQPARVCSLREVGRSQEIRLRPSSSIPGPDVSILRLVVETA